MPHPLRRGWGFVYTRLYAAFRRDSTGEGNLQLYGAHMTTTIEANLAATPSIPPHFAEPPPAPLREPALDPEVGWVNGTAIGFRGFTTDVEAAHAAWVAYRTMARRLAWRLGTRPLPVDMEPVSLSGDHILAGGLPIATLVGPGPESPSGEHWFGFELQVPLPVDELQMHRTALALQRALRRAGIRWGMFERRPQKPRATRGAEIADAEQQPLSAWRQLSIPARAVAARALAIVGIALLFVIVALADRIMSPPTPDAIPLYVIAFAGFGAALVGGAIRRWTTGSPRPATLPPPARHLERSAPTARRIVPESSPVLRTDH